MVTHGKTPSLNGVFLRANHVPVKYYDWLKCARSLDRESPVSPKTESPDKLLVVILADDLLRRNNQ